MASTIGYSEIDLPAPPANPSPNTSTVNFTYGTMLISCPGGSETVNWSSMGPPLVLGQGCTSTVLTTNHGSFSISRHNLGGVLGFNAQTVGRVGIAVLPSGGTVVAYSDWINNQDLTFAVADADFNWFGPTASGETSLLGVDLAPLGSNGEVQFSWAGMDGANTVNYATAGVIALPWEVDEFELTKQTFNGQTSFGACAVAARTTVPQGWVAWTGTDTNHSLNLMGPFSQGYTSTQFILGNDSSRGAPRLCYMDAAVHGSPVDSQYLLDHIYLTWAGTDSNNSINILDINGGDMTGTKWVIAQPTQCAPALLALGTSGQNELYMAWVDWMTGQVTMAWCPDPDMHHWQMVTRFSAQARSDVGVTLALHPNGLQILVGYTDMDLNMNVGSVPTDPTKW